MSASIPVSYTHLDVYKRQLKPYERFLANFTHAALYFLIFAMPLTGWIMTSARGFPVDVYKRQTRDRSLIPRRSQRSKSTSPMRLPRARVSPAAAHVTRSAARFSSRRS